MGEVGTKKTLSEIKSDADSSLSNLQRDKTMAK